MKKALVVIFSLLLIMAMFAGCGDTPADSPAPADPPADAPLADAPPADTSADDGKTYSLTFNTYIPEMLPPAVFLQAAADAIEERSNGRIQIECFYSGTLLTGADSIQGCSDGIADVIMCTSTNMTEVFPLNNVMCMPYLTTPPAKDRLDATYNQLVADRPEIAEELAAMNLRYVGLISTGGYHAHGIKTVFDDISDFAGKTLEAAGDGATLVQALGGNGTNMDVGDYYMSMSTGLLDGQLVHFASPHGFGTEELLTTHVVFSNNDDLSDVLNMYGGGLYAPIMCFLMNLETFNELPADLQEIVLEEFGKFSEVSNSPPDSDSVTASIKTFTDRGDTFVFIGDEGRKAWEEPITAVVEGWVDRCVAAGYTADQCWDLYNYLCELFTQH